MTSKGKLIFFTLLLAALATVCKYFFGPDLDWSGFSPIIAIALFSGLIIKERNISFLLPLLALFISDVAIQFLYKQGLFPYAGFYKDQWINYLLLLGCTLIGWIIQAKKYSNLAVASVAAPTLFYLASNFIVWTGSQVSYTKDFNGLLKCYIAALPFYERSLIATIVFLPIIIFLYNYLMKHRTQVLLAN